MGRREYTRGMKICNNNTPIKEKKDPKDVRSIKASSPNQYTLQNIQMDDKQEIGLVSGEEEEKMAESLASDNREAQ